MKPGHPGMRRLGLGVGLGEEHHDPRAPAVRHPHLLAGDDVVVAVADGDRADRLHVGPRVRLGHRERRAELHRGEPRQVRPSLLLRPVEPDHRRGDEGAVEDPRQRHPAARELHHDQRVRVEPEAETPVLLGDRRPEQPHLAHRLDHRLGELVRVLELGGDGHDVAVDELPHRRHDLDLLGGQRHAGTASESASGASAAATSSSSSSERSASSSASTAASPSASEALSRNFSRTSSGVSGLSGPPRWYG